jgi:hypothetical protein
MLSFEQECMKYLNYYNLSFDNNDNNKLIIAITIFNYIILFMVLLTIVNIIYKIIMKIIKYVLFILIIVIFSLNIWMLLLKISKYMDENCID